jgi:trk system potassium uptake protein TrkH
MFRRLQPATFSILSFAALIAAGTGLLLLPWASSGPGLRMVDALFTATSATCVTGLVVVDTGKDLSLLGQWVVLVLIQLGGLGIMSLSTVFLLFAGRLTLGGQTVVRETFTHGGELRLTGLLLDVIRFTLAMESIGALLLFSRFFHGHSLSEALYLAIFHAVSAFCNAGFSLFSDSFLAYRDDWLVNLTICMLIISGGIGFLVMRELKRTLIERGRRFARLSLHSKIILSTTGMLLLMGTLLILWAERFNTLSAQSLPERVLAAFFQSVTARTAGFNTLPIAALANETIFILIILMFIGAASGSCGGGIKVGTFATLMTLGVSRLRGYDRPLIFRRTISTTSVGRAVSVLMVSVTVIVAATLALLGLEGGNVPYALSRARFMEVFFEVVSAFGTVGLSMGITDQLGTASKLVVTAVMFIGRLGPLVIVMAMSRRHALGYHFAEENIMIG